MNIDELARFFEGKSLVVDCALDDVSNMWGLQRRLQETRTTCRASCQLNHVTALQWPM